MELALLIFCIASFIMGVLCYKNVTLVTIHVGDNPIYGFRLGAPVYEVAVRHIRERYNETLGSLTHVWAYQPGYDLCADGGDHAAETFLGFYYSHPEIFKSESVFPVLASPECSSQAIQLADLARDYDLPFFTSVAGDLRLTNKVRYSTTAATASLSGPDVGGTIRALLEKFSWRTVTLICDSLTRHIGLSNFFVIQCGDAKRLLESQGYTWYFQQIDSSIQRNYPDLLRSFKDRCRVFVFLTMPSYLRLLMVTAHELKMTSGGFVFITLQPTERPGIVAVDWRQSDDRQNNGAALEAYKHLIVLSGLNPNWAEIRSLTDEISQEGVRMFNRTTKPGDEKNEQITSVYESTIMFAQIFTENYPNVFTMPKKAFIQTYFNRTFHYAGRDVFTDANGGMINFLMVNRLNPATTEMELAMMYNAPLRKFENIVPELWYWVGRSSPPPDKPVCGFQETDCDDSMFGPTVRAAVAAAGSVIFLVVVGSILYCWRKRNQELMDKWWELDPYNFSFIDKPTEKLDAKALLTEKIMGVIVKYNAREMYALRIPATSDALKHASNNIDFLRTLYEIRSLQHYNIAKFGGLARIPSGSFLLSEFCPKQTLRQVLDNEKIQVDNDLRFSMFWDLAEGIDYLHHSPAGHHGNLSSLLCVLDARYGLKISQVNYSKLMQLLHVSAQSDTAAQVQLLWKPPEVILSARGKTKPGTKAASMKDCDIYANAIILYEIYTRKPPCEVDLTSSKQVEDALEKLVSAGGFRLDSSITQIPDNMQTLLRSCYGPAGSRPNIKSFKQSLQGIQRKPTAYLSHVMRQLEIHAENLEDIVAERNRELQCEMRKADLLLQEILPVSVVKRLRNKEAVTAESFTHVTIMFCDLPAFGKIASVCTPLQIISFLNKVYSIFDEVIHAFDVYKVETINDSYIIASGLPKRNGDDHGSQICRLGLTLTRLTAIIKDPTNKTSTVLLRVGINSGPIVAAVIGAKMPRYCLFGDTMNTSSRMESHGEGGKIHISGSTQVLVKDDDRFALKAREPIVVKGKGTMQTYWLTGNRKEEPAEVAKFPAADNAIPGIAGAPSRILTET